MIDEPHHHPSHRRGNLLRSAASRISAGARLGALALACLLLSAHPRAEAVSEPPVQPGTVLSITVLEEADFQREVRVNAAGRIMLPIVGELDVAGLQLAAISGLVEQALRDNGVLLTPTVIVEVARYRPVYVGGTVSKPGAVEFEPGLTVRHALILAGGLALDDEDERLSVPSLLGLRARLEGIAYRLMQAEGRIARLQAELDDEETVEPGGLDDAMANPDAAASVLAMEQQFLADRRTERTNEETHLEALEKLIDLEVDVLTQQETLQQQERDVQREELENARSLVQRGLMPLPRLQELRREESRLSRDLLENRSFAARARQTRETVGNDRVNSRIRWRIDTREKLADRLAERAQLEAEVRALTTSMMVAGGAFAAQPGLRTPSTEVTIFRQTTGGGEETIDATPGTPLMPGDVVSVTIALDPQG